MPKIKIQDRTGAEVDFEVGMDLYRRAADNKRSPRLEARYMASEQQVAWDPSKGDLLDQMFVSSGLFDSKFGGNSPTIGDLSKAQLADGFRRPDGSDTSLGARLLFPQVIMETLQGDLLDKDGSDILNVWNGMVANTQNVKGQRADQPIINADNKPQPRSGRITQLAEPERMISITTGQKAYYIPTNSIGLMISDEARSATTVDIVRIVMANQAREDRIARINEQLKSMVLGDADLGMSALPTEHAYDYDSTLATNGGISKKAYLKWLQHKANKANLTRCLTDIDTALTLDEALLVSNKSVDPAKIQAPFAGVKLSLPDPTFTLVENTLFGANLIVGLDPRYAINRFVNVDAAYDAIENYVMRKATAFRVDYGEMSTRLFDGAWSVLSLAKA